MLAMHAAPYCISTMLNLVNFWWPPFLRTRMKVWNKLKNGEKNYFQWGIITSVVTHIKMICFDTKVLHCLLSQSLFAYGNCRIQASRQLLIGITKECLIYKWTKLRCVQMNTGWIFHLDAVFIWGYSGLQKNRPHLVDFHLKMLIHF